MRVLTLISATPFFSPDAGWHIICLQTNHYNLLEVPYSYCFSLAVCAELKMALAFTIKTNGGFGYTFFHLKIYQCYVLQVTLKTIKRYRQCRHHCHVGAVWCWRYSRCTLGGSLCYTTSSFCCCFCCIFIPQQLIKNRPSALERFLAGVSIWVVVLAVSLLFG